MFLLAESKYPGCTRLAEIMEDLSHHSVNRFLLRERYEPKDLFDEIKLNINLIGGTLSGAEVLIENWYELQRNLSLQVARDFILEHLSQKLCWNA